MAAIRTYRRLSDRGPFRTAGFLRSASSLAAPRRSPWLVAAQKLFGDTNPVGRQVFLWKQPFQVVGVVSSGSWMVTPAAGDDQFDAFTCRSRRFTNC
jgi:hypothetical protein